MSSSSERKKPLQFGPNGCQANVNGEKCGEKRTLGIIDDFKSLYEKKLKEIESYGSGDGNLKAKINLQEQWIKDLQEQNEMMVTAIEELEKEATDRVKMLEDKLDNSSKCICEVMKRYQDYNYTLNLDETFQKTFYMKNDITNLLEFVRRIREDHCWNIDGLTFYEISYTDLFGCKDTKFDCVKSSDPCGALCDSGMQSLNIGESEEINNEKLEDTMKSKDKDLDTLKKCMLDMRKALTEEVANKHDIICALKRDITKLEEQCIQVDKQTAFKDDIIKELRKEIKQLKLGKSDSLSSELASAKSSEKERALENTKLKSKIEDAKALSKKLAKDYENSFEEKNDLKKKLKAEKEEKEKQADEAKTLGTTCGVKLKEISNLKDEIDKLKKELDKAKQENKDLKKKIDDLEEDQNKLKKKLRDANDDKERSNKELEKTKKDNRDLKKKLDDLEDDVSKLKKKLKDAKDDKEKLESLNDDLKKSNSKKDKEISKLKGDNEDSEKENKKLADENKKLKNDNDKLKKELDEEKKDEPKKVEPKKGEPVAIMAGVAVRGLKDGPVSAVVCQSVQVQTKPHEHKCKTDLCNCENINSDSESDSKSDSDLDSDSDKKKKPAIECSPCKKGNEGDNKLVPSLKTKPKDDKNSKVSFKQEPDTNCCAKKPTSKEETSRETSDDDKPRRSKCKNRSKKPKRNNDEPCHCSGPNKSKRNNDDDDGKPYRCPKKRSEKPKRNDDDDDDEPCPRKRPNRSKGNDDEPRRCRKGSNKPKDSDDENCNCCCSPKESDTDSDDEHCSCCCSPRRSSKPQHSDDGDCSCCSPRKPKHRDNENCNCCCSAKGSNKPKHGGDEDCICCCSPRISNKSQHSIDKNCNCCCSQRGSNKPKHSDDENCRCYCSQREANKPKHHDDENCSCCSPRRSNRPKHSDCSCCCSQKKAIKPKPSNDENCNCWCSPKRSNKPKHNDDENCRCCCSQRKANKPKHSDNENCICCCSQREADKFKHSDDENCRCCCAQREANKPKHNVCCCHCQKEPHKQEPEHNIDKPCSCVKAPVQQQPQQNVCPLCCCPMESNKQPVNNVCCQCQHEPQKQEPEHNTDKYSCVKAPVQQQPQQDVYPLCCCPKESNKQPANIDCICQCDIGSDCKDPKQDKPKLISCLKSCKTYANRNRTQKDDVCPCECEASCSPSCLIKNLQKCPSNTTQTEDMTPVAIQCSPRPNTACEHLNEISGLQTALSDCRGRADNLQNANTIACLQSQINTLNNEKSCYEELLRYFKHEMGEMSEQLCALQEILKMSCVTSQTENHQLVSAVEKLQCMNQCLSSEISSIDHKYSLECQMHKLKESKLFDMEKKLQSKCLELSHANDSCKQLSTQLERVLHRNQQFENIICKCNCQLRKLQKTLQEYECENDKQMCDRSKCQCEILQCQKHLQELNKMLQKKDCDLECLQKEYREHLKELEKVKEELCNKHNIVNQLKKCLCESKEDNAVLYEECKDLKQQINCLTREDPKTKRQLKVYQKIIIDIKNMLTERDSPIFNHLPDLKQSPFEIEIPEDKYLQMADEIKEIIFHLIQIFCKSKEENKKAQDEINMLHQKIVSLSRKELSKENELKIFHRILNELKDILSRSDEADCDHQVTQKTKTQDNTTEDVQKQMVGEIKQMVCDFKKQLKEKNCMIKQLEKQVNLNEESLKNSKKCKKDNETICQKLAHSQGEEKRLSQTVKKLEYEVSTLRGELKEKDKQINCFCENLQKMKSGKNVELTCIQDECNVLKNEINRLTQRQIYLTEENEKLATNVIRFQKRATELEEKNIIMKDQLEQYLLELESIHHEKEVIEHKYHKLTCDFQSLQNNFSCLERQNRILKQSASNHQTSRPNRSQSRDRNIKCKQQNLPETSAWDYRCDSPDFTVENERSRRCHTPTWSLGSQGTGSYFYAANEFSPQNPCDQCPSFQDWYSPNFRDNEETDEEDVCSEQFIEKVQSMVAQFQKANKLWKTKMNNCEYCVSKDEFS